MSTETLVARLRRRGRESPDQLLYTFVDDGGSDVDRLTCGEALHAAEAIARRLRASGLRPEDRVLLVHAPGLDFVRALLGCLLARVVPVPVASPNPFDLDHELPGLAALARASEAKAVLCDDLYGALAQPSASVPGLAALPWHPTRAPDPGPDAVGDDAPEPTMRDVAFVQYTSGSTSSPKGVLLTFGNLDHQLTNNVRDLGIGPTSRMVAWVPHYHDFGLVSGILAALHTEAALWLLSPLTFVQRPHLWCAVLSRVQATHTAAPNFAYELLVRKTTPEQRATWDLSALQVVMSAAEPVRAGTVRAFLDAFAVSRLDPGAFCPAYGLAEHTVGISVRGRGTLRLDRGALEHEGRAVPSETGTIELVGCGWPSEGVRVRIVDPETGAVRPEDATGEIWVDSPSKALGYDALPDETRHTFEARLPGDDTAYLRTGDLGFLHDGQLYIVGRLKDLLIVNGRNLHPQDLEESVRACHPLVRPGGIAAFGVAGPDPDTDELALIVELKTARVDEAHFDAIVAAVRACVAAEHKLACPVVILGRPGAALKTSSGKLRRRACRAAFERGGLDALHVDRSVAKPTLATMVDGLDAEFRALVGALGAWFGRAATARKGRVFHKEATTLLGVLEATPDPALPSHPLFAAGARHAVLVRHANGVQEDDAAADNRGATVRVLDGSGADLSASLLDLLLTTGRTFLAPTAAAFQRWMTGSPDDRAAIARAAPHLADAAWGMFREPTSYCAVHYHSKTASTLVGADGRRHLVRFRLRHRDCERDGGFVRGETVLPADVLPRRPDDLRSPTFLHEELRARVASSGVDYLLELQVRPYDEDALDCTRDWDDATTPWRLAARLHLDRVADAKAVDGLQFNSRHAPAGLTPPTARSPHEFASLEQLRQLVYEFAASARTGAPLPPELRALAGRPPREATATHPADRRSERVCVIGGGPSGLSAAHHLSRLGHRVTVLERAPAVAGKCASIELDGQPYDLGGHLCTPQYKALARLIADVGATIEPATPTYLWDATARAVTPWDDGPAVREAFLRYRALRDRELADLDAPGFSQVAPRLARPTREWLDANGLAPLGVAIGASYTSTGYGYLNDPQIPALYFVRAAETAGLLAGADGGALPRYWTVAGGMQGLWRRVAARLDVRTGVRVRAVERRNGRVVVLADRERLEFDRLVLAVPLDDALGFLDATIEERELFGEIRTLDYYTTVARVRGLPESGFYIVRENTDDPARIGHVVAFHHRHPGSDVVLFYAYGDDTVDAGAVDRYLREDVARLGGTLDEVVLQRKWKYFPHVGPDALDSGYYERLERLQGQNQTWYVGSLLNFELIECNVAYAERLVAQHFADPLPVPAAPAKAARPGASQPLDAPTLVRWLTAHASSAAGRTVGADDDLAAMGIDSVALMGLVAALSDHVGFAVSPAVLYEARTATAVARRVSDPLVASDAPPRGPSPRVDEARVRAWWRKALVPEPWPGEDLFLGLVRTFVDDVRVHPDVTAAWRTGPCLYLGNHQTGIETPLFTTLIGALGEREITALGKAEHRTSWLGTLLEQIFAYPGARPLSRLVYFERADGTAWSRVLSELAAHLRDGRSVLVHADGTRARSAGESVRVVNPALIMLALEVGVPIVPVRFAGGLPRAPLADKVEFPVGAQRLHLGRPLAPHTLATLGHVQRIDAVVRAIDEAGGPLHADEPGRPVPSLASVQRDAEDLRISPADALLRSILQQWPHPSPDTLRLREAASRAETFGDDARGQWLRGVATRLGFAGAAR